MNPNVVVRDAVSRAAIVLVLGGCGGGDTATRGDAGGPDAGVDDAFPTPPHIPWLEDGAPPVAPPDIPWLGDGAAPIAPPDIPWLDDGVPPISWPCPEGWRSVTEGGVTTCDPYPVGGAETCPNGEADFPGETGGGDGCVPIGRPCGTETFPPVDDLPPATRVRYVLAGGPEGGDGSRASPYASIASALDDAVAGTALVLGAGTYEVDQAWPDDVSVRGLCARDTSLVASSEAGGPEAVLTVSGGIVTARDLRIGPTPRQGVQASGADTRIELHGVWITGATRQGVALASGAHLVATLLVVDDTQATESGLDGSGLEIRSGASATMTRALLVRNRSHGVQALGAESSFEALELSIVGTQPSPEGRRGWGLSVEQGARAVVEHALIASNRGAGALIFGAGSTLELRGAVVRDTLPTESDGSGGRGLVVERDASALVERSLVEGNREVGLFATDRGTSLTVRDAVVRDTLSRQRDGAFGWGLGVVRSASAVVERAVFERNRDAAVLGSGNDAVLELRDTAIRDTLPQKNDDSLGRGLDVQGGASAIVEATLFERNRDVGVFAAGSDTTLRLRSAVVRDTLSRVSDGSGGRGLSVQEGATAVAERVRFERNRDVGVFIFGGQTTLALRDAVVRETLPQEDSGAFGTGINVQQGATAVVEHALFEQNRLVGVSVFGESASLELRDAVVRDTLPQEVDGGFGRGVGVHLGARAVIERVLFERNREVGVSAADPGTLLALRHSIVRDTRERESDGTGGRGLSLRLGAAAVVERTLFEGNRTVAVDVSRADTTLALRDSVLRETLPRASDSSFGWGLNLRLGAEAAVERALIERNRDIGVFVGGADAVLEAHDAVVRDTLAQESDGSAGRGLNVQDGAVAVIERALIERNRDIGVFASANGATLELRDAVVRDTLPQASDDSGGRGLGAELGGTVFVERCQVEGNRELGIFAAGADATVELRDTVVRDTLAPACAPDCSSGLDYGAGLASAVGARITATDFVVETSDLCGLVLGGDGEADLNAGLVTDHPIAVCLQIRDFDTARLQRDVRYENNDRLIEATMLVLPEPAAAVDAPRP